MSIEKGNQGFNINITCTSHRFNLNILHSDELPRSWSLGFTKPTLKNTDMTCVTNWNQDTRISPSSTKLNNLANKDAHGNCVNSLESFPRETERFFHFDLGLLSRGLLFIISQAMKNVHIFLWKICNYVSLSQRALRNTHTVFIRK